ncbi:hypothetical protein D9M68_466240 [compost metagenome]
MRQKAGRRHSHLDATDLLHPIHGLIGNGQAEDAVLGAGHSAAERHLGEDRAGLVADGDREDIGAVYQRSGDVLYAVAVEVPDGFAQRLGACGHQQFDVVNPLACDAVAGDTQEENEQRGNENEHCATDNRNKSVLHGMHHRMHALEGAATHFIFGFSSV